MKMYMSYRFLIESQYRRGAHWKPRGPGCRTVAEAQVKAQTLMDQDSGLSLRIAKWSYDPLLGYGKRLNVAPIVNLKGLKS